MIIYDEIIRGELEKYPYASRNLRQAIALVAADANKTSAKIGRYIPKSRALFFISLRFPSFNNIYSIYQTG